LLNTVPGGPQFDKFPFTFLTLTVSLEAILLSAFILISQNEETRVADRRNALDLQVNLLSRATECAVATPARLGLFFLVHRLERCNWLRTSDGQGLQLLLFVKGEAHGWRFDYSKSLSSRGITQQSRPCLPAPPGSAVPSTCLERQYANGSEPQPACS
jgi:hypothetical protein